MSTTVWLFEPRSHGRRKADTRARATGPRCRGGGPVLTSHVPHRSASPALCPCGHAASFRRRASSFVARPVCKPPERGARVPVCNATRGDHRQACLVDRPVCKPPARRGARVCPCARPLEDSCRTKSAEVADDVDGIVVIIVIADGPLSLRPLSPCPYKSAVPKGPAFSFLNYYEVWIWNCDFGDGNNVMIVAKILIRKTLLQVHPELPIVVVDEVWIWNCDFVDGWRRP